MDCNSTNCLMTVRVDRIRGSFRLQDRFGNVEFITNSHNDKWDRSFAKMALDLYERVYKYKRRAIRFYVN